MDEKEREAIGKQARELLEKFGKALESVKLKEKKKERKVGGFREEKIAKTGDVSFRKIMFENAPEKNDDFILGEKKRWE